eukprot:TRINITY_DN2080_c0_g1_i2.p1 TRINITY_DN2080_c0_g1~~TRINITY_DN2080_c0_g1_i2.p1  ORF type:complete len:218 (-),score=26.29 TRINITY_DN2080_c0_g1_i2:179-832(-)
MSRFVGFLNGANQYGRWIPEAQIKARAIAGGATLDFSQALFTEPIITIHATAFWGGVTLIVPPNVTVEQDGRAILGGFGSCGGVYRSAHTSLAECTSNSDVTIRVVGTAVMGAVKALVNRNAPFAQLLTWDKAQGTLLEPAPASTTREDMRQQILNDALARRLASAHLAAAAVLQAATGTQTCNAQVSQHGVVAQGVPASAAGRDLAQGVPVAVSGK